MKRTTLIFLGAIALVATIASFIASSSPDGLNRVAGDLGFDGKEATLYHAPLPDYAVPRLPDSLSGVAAALLGTALVGGLAWGAGKLLVRPSRS